VVSGQWSVVRFKPEGNESKRAALIRGSSTDYCLLSTDYFLLSIAQQREGIDRAVGGVDTKVQMRRSAAGISCCSHRA
jgi:hypothetical protein